jgi:hypothetical protein
VRIGNAQREVMRVLVVVLRRIDEMEVSLV